MDYINNVKIITGKQHVDQRGILNHFNDLNLTPMKRMYILEHPDRSIIRAWLGHKKESKWFFVLNGSFKIVIVQPDDWQQPSSDLNYDEFLLQENKNEILHVPGGHAVGFKANDRGSKLMVFSNATLEESLHDDFRFDKNLWYNWKE